MTIFEQAEKYLSAIPPAISGQGGHSQTLHAARALKIGFNLSDNQAFSLLEEWNRSCQPPWTESELLHKIKEADEKPFGKPRGYLVPDKDGRVHYEDTRPKRRTAEEKKIDLIVGNYELTEDHIIPMPEEPIECGFKTILENVFKSDDVVRIMRVPGPNSNPDPLFMTPAEFKQLFATRNTEDINKLYSPMRPGMYIGINPMKDGGNTDSDVTDYRHCLLEFDHLPKEMQWTLFMRSRLPCAAVIDSGKRSLHAWVKIEARNLAEFNERVDLVYKHFAPYRPDNSNRNPSRFSRLPDAYREEGYQRLLATNTGAANFQEWYRERIAQAIGKTYDQEDIIEYKPEEDGRTLAGHRWLRKGGSCILAGPSGIGKSSLGRQLAISWALGIPCFGVKPIRPLKILFIQAENDMADLHDMDVGIYQGLNVLEDGVARQLIRKNLITNHNVADTGYNFILALKSLVEHHLPDLVVLDPLLSFIGADISRQEVVGEFCRNWLNPILASANTGVLAIHHTAKPPKEKQQFKKGAKRLNSEVSYDLFGSSELTNWARAVMVLSEVDGVRFELVFAKRGRRAEAEHPNGAKTNIVKLRHSLDGIYWFQDSPKEEPVSAAEEEADTPPPNSKAVVSEAAKLNHHDFICAIPAEGIAYNELLAKLEEYMANTHGIDIKPTSLKRLIAKLVKTKKLAKKGVLYIKGNDA